MASKSDKSSKSSKSSTKHSLCIIIPVHNEEKVVSHCVTKVMQTLRSMKEKTALIVVNDGSIDKSENILQQLLKKYPEKLIVVSHKKNLGYGAGLTTGIRTAVLHKFEYCIFMDSDLTNDPGFIPEFAKKMSEGYDCVKASRYIRGGGMVGVPAYRQLLSRMGNLIASMLFGMGIHDCTNGFRMVRLSLLSKITFHETGFPIILEELYQLKKMKARVTEIPNILTTRQHGDTHFPYTWKTLYAYAKYAITAAFLF